MQKLNICALPCFLLLGITILSGTVSLAQDKAQPISLEKVLELGSANNLIIKEYRQRQELALADLEKRKEWWLPDIYAGFSTEKLFGAVMNGNGRFFLDVNRGNFWTGLGLDAQWNFGNGIFQSKAAGLRVQASGYQTLAERNKILLQSIFAYYDFQVAQLYYKAYENIAQQADTVSQQIDIQVQAGLRYQSELLLSKSNISHLKIEMLNARSEYYRRSAELIKLLNLNPGTKLVSVDTVLSPLMLVNNQDMLPVFDSIYQRRPEIKRMDLLLQSLEWEKKTTTKGLLIPQLRLGAYSAYFGGLFKTVTPMDPVAYPKTNTLYPTSAINVVLQWRVPLGRLAYAGDLKQYNARIRLHRIQTEQIQAEVNNEVIDAREQVAVAEEQIKIAIEGSGQASEALQQSIQRQQLGTVRPFEILQAQEIYIKSRLDYLKAVTAFNKAQYALYVAMGNNL